MPVLVDRLVMLLLLLTVLHVLVDDEAVDVDEEDDEDVQALATETLAAEDARRTSSLEAFMWEISCQSCEENASKDPSSNDMLPILTSSSSTCGCCCLPFIPVLDSDAETETELSEVGEREDVTEYLLRTGL